MKRKILSIPVLLIFALSTTYPVKAAETSPKSSAPAELILDDLIRYAEEKSPEILTAQADWLAAKKRVWIDSSLPDPVVGFDIMADDHMVETRVGPQKDRLVVYQEIPFPWKLYEKGKAAHEEAKSIYFRYLAVKRDVINKLRKFYYELYFADASIQTLEETKELLKKFEGVAQARYASLSGTQRDAAKAQAEVSLSLEKLYQLRQQRETVAAMINALLDRDPMTEVGRPKLPPVPVLTKPLIELVNLAVQNREEIREAEAVVAKSAHNKRLAALAYLPDLNAGFEYTWVGSGTTTDPMDGRDSWMFPLRFSVPLWQNRIVPEILEARKIQESAQAKLLQAKNTAYFDVKNAYYRFDAAAKTAELYDTAIIPQAQIALSADQAGYESGKTDFLNLLDSERVYLNARLSRIQFMTEALKGYADLERATGYALDHPENEQERK